MNVIDMRSDTVTWPTPEMRKAMANAEVGDDVYGEDPTVNRLEAMAAAHTGKEAALFVTSGTMGNLTAIMTHCQRGDELIVGQKGHTYTDEVGGSAALAGVHTFTVPTESDGTLSLENVANAVRDPNDIHYPRSRLLMLENTNGSRGGIPLTVDYMQRARETADEYGLLIHVDGARIWNAAVALGCSVADLVEPADSVSFCISKGLCAPAGSLLCGSREFIDRARRIRKMLGGGMRQVGVLAAAGVVALEQMTRRLADDHANAKLLAEGLSSIPGVNVEMAQVRTNMVLFWLSDFVPVDASYIAAELDMRYNIRIEVRTQRSFRAVTHYWITPDRINETAQALREVIQRATG